MPMTSSETQRSQVLLPPVPSWPDTPHAKPGPEADRLLQKLSHRVCIESCASVSPECHATKSRVVSNATLSASSMIRSDSASSGSDRMVLKPISIHRSPFRSLSPADHRH